MTAIFSLILGGLWKPITAALGALGLYLRGRSDASRNAELEAWRAANEAERQRAETDRDARSGDARDRLRNDWSRD